MSPLAIRQFPSELPFPFSKAVEAGGFLFLSGQVSMADTGEPIYGDIQTQTRNVMQAIRRTLRDCGSDWDAVVKATVWLSDMKHFPAFNQEYRTFFSQGFPARSVVGCQLAFGLDVEIEVQAIKKDRCQRKPLP
jgi:reactive intermediate/imine deaminase